MADRPYDPDISSGPVTTEGGTDADLNRANLLHQDADGTLVGRAVTINRPREELYAFWRDFSNLAPLMDNIERIETRDDKRSHWVVKGPAGKDVEWDAIVTEDEPGRRIAWRADDDADIKNSGWIEFRDGPTGRGTEVHALIEYDAPGGMLGRLVAKALQREPNTQARRELRRFKQLMETGEITNSEGPRGS
jgi:uncharacterized membrane protein